MTEAPVLVIALDPAQAMRFCTQWGEIRTRHKDAKLILLTTSPMAASLEKAGRSDEIWQEGSVRGLFRLLALLRRISWMGFSDIYDLEQNSFTRLIRWSVWPRPHWHRGDISAVS